MSDQQYLFVYGSLCDGMVHYNKIAGYVKSQQPGATEGRVYRLQVGYPVYLTQGEDSVEGTLLQIEASDVLYSILDEFHGFSPLAPQKSLFLKTEVQVRLEDGQRVMAVAYALNPAKLPKTARLIEGGDWKQSLKEAPVATNALTERQINYVKKLGASTGRDIVPIDLDLYRELMKLDVIVDKGRRLALTKFGKEIYRYLP